ncbi:hypothetical protein BCR39DRAFT_562195 [Naematelia encephala]|uniref:DUF6604 domain-containing protein n=1 Tax=Naematelia encephala TaxID=71784 RepID=A0A1Y2AJV0_9TREE|nr:hypothetical protein BCR39DRAFT_562195 [Naematelia encephala]
MPRFLRTKYQQYKNDTFQLSTWLAEAAFNFGYPLDAFAEAEGVIDGTERRTAQQLRNAKKKAKGRAKAKGGALENQEQNVDGRTVTQVQGDYVLKIWQFKEMASFLVEQNAPIAIELIRLLRRCISTRVQCLRRFSSAPDVSIESHQHIINILSDIAVRFEDHRAAQTEDPIRRVDVPSRLLADSNASRYAPLAAEEDNNEAEDMPDINLPEPPRYPSVPIITLQAHFVPEEDIEEIVMALLTFFADIRSIREYISALWTDYGDERINLMTAAVTTNTALELLRSAMTISPSS